MLKYEIEEDKVANFGSIRDTDVPINDTVEAKVSKLLAIVETEDVTETNALAITDTDEVKDCKLGPMADTDDDKNVKLCPMDVKLVLMDEKVVDTASSNTLE